MLILILGGARSGKSGYAQSRCARSSRVFFLATAHLDDSMPDEEMRARIARHRADRPAHWETIEESLDLRRAIEEVPVDAVLLLDCVTLWLSNLMWHYAGLATAEQEKAILGRTDELIAALRRRGGTGAESILVSNEVGSGIVPDSLLGRAFRDLQGFTNQRLAQAADEVVLVVAGLPLILKPALSPRET